MSKLPFTKCDVCNSKTFPGASCLTCHIKHIQAVRDEDRKQQLGLVKYLISRIKGAIWKS